MVLAGQSCNSQTKETKPARIDRQPAVAGKFYPAAPDDLNKMLTSFFPGNRPEKSDNPLALIVPHAGYVFSGSTAAAAYKQINRDTKFRHIFIIGSSHTTYFNGASIYDQGNYITPLGKVPTDTLSSWLVNQYKFFTNNTGPHVAEHGLEVQLPFLQYWLKNDFTIVPIIIGGLSKENCNKIAAALTPFFNTNNLFVISTDFSHYPEYQDAIASDNKMAHAILTNSAKDFLLTKKQIEGSGMNNLSTAICGWTSVLTLLNITENMPGIKYNLIKYTNSGDSYYGDKDKVVGYCAIDVTRDHTETTTWEYLNENDKSELLKIARHTLKSYLTESVVPDYNKDGLSANLQKPAGAFVTLKLNGNLRGCIGNFNPDKPLFQTIQDMAIAAATQDPRFSPVKPDGLDKLEVEISVLTPLKKISSPDEFIPGRHGIYIRKGGHSGTFLPQVATETGWSKEELLGHCARDKAHIGWEGWKTAELYTYEAIVFSEHEFTDSL
jgi:MEMO1 family protein